MSSWGLFTQSENNTKMKCICVSTAGSYRLQAPRSESVLDRRWPLKVPTGGMCQCARGQVMKSGGVPTATSAKSSDLVSREKFCSDKTNQKAKQASTGETWVTPQKTKSTARKQQNYWWETITLTSEKRRDHLLWRQICVTMTQEHRSTEVILNSMTKLQWSLMKFFIIVKVINQYAFQIHWQKW